MYGAKNYLDTLRRDTSTLLFIAAMVLFYCLVLLLFRGHASAAPEVFTVTTTANSGEGSLFKAMEDANSNGNSGDVDIIEFNIPGTGVHTIAPTGILPVPTEPLLIDGYSQPGSQANTAISPEPFNGTITIEINGANAGAPMSGLILQGVDGSTVRGISIHSYTTTQIVINSNDITLEGNYIGVKPSGVEAGSGNGGGINTTPGCSNLAIGGSSPENRNIITASQNKNNSAVSMDCTQSTMYGNYIGIGKDGATQLTNSVGTVIGSSLLGNDPVAQNITIGGGEPGQANVYNGGLEAAIVIFTTHNTVQGNFIGTDYKGELIDDSDIVQGPGVVLQLFAAENLIGGTGENEANVIADVAGGVVVNSLDIVQIGGGATPQKNAILGNSIFKMKTKEIAGVLIKDIGIELVHGKDTDFPPDFWPNEYTSKGPTPNDPGDVDTGPNGYINTPVLKTAQQVGNQLTVTYDLDAADSPSNTYRVEFFASNNRSMSGYGPGETYLGAATAVAPGSNKTATLTVSGDFSNKFLSATTTAIDNTTSSGFGATSEFARNISVGAADDFDADGLSDAIEDAAPNNGDGNNDGTPDKLQPTVTSFAVTTTNGTASYATLVTAGCVENGTVTHHKATTLPQKDTGYDYPYGLTDFTLYCSQGDTATVTMYMHHQTDANPEKFVPRKYNATTKTYTDINGSTVSKEVLGASTALKLTYSIQDGSSLDADATPNGIIVDPVGFATENSGMLANTGVIAALLSIIGSLLIVGAVYTYADYRKHKKPLLEADPLLANGYTYWHHLKMVTIPLVRYRVSVIVEKKGATSVGLSPRL